MILSLTKDEAKTILSAVEDKALRMSDQWASHPELSKLISISEYMRRVLDAHKDRE